MLTNLFPAPAFLLPGNGEWVVLGLLALLLFGYKRLPEAARSLGRAWGEFRKGLREGEAEGAAKAPHQPESAQSSVESAPTADLPALDTLASAKAEAKLTPADKNASGGN